MTEVHLDRQEAAASDLAADMGAQLRQLREARGETASDVAHSLKLTSRQIEAMEAGRLDLLPGAAFARGFLRNYARYLGIDPAAVLAAFEAEVTPQTVELAPVSNAVGIMPSGGGRSMQIPVGLIAGVLVLVVLVGWYFDWFRMPAEQAEVAESVAEPAAQIAPAVTSVAAAPQAQVSESALAASGVVPSQPVPVPATPAIPAPVAAAVPAAPASAAPVPGPAALAPAGAAAQTVPPAASALAAGAAPATATADGVEHLVFRFEGESWIEVRDAGGSIVYSGMNGPGSTRTVQGKPPFALVVGNARQVSLDYRGKPYDLKPHMRVSVARFTLE